MSFYPGPDVHEGAKARSGGKNCQMNTAPLIDVQNWLEYYLATHVSRRKMATYEARITSKNEKRRHYQYYIFLLEWHHARIDQAKS